MRKVSLFAVAAAIAATGLGASLVMAQQKAAANTVVVYKTATCGCCGIWVEHLKVAGFQVETHNVEADKVAAVGKDAGVTDELSSCHTAKVGGYVVEGHVPAADIQRMLREKPAIAGIAAPGMPLGSPGMEAGGRKEAYDVIAFTKDGKKSVFASHK